MMLDMPLVVERVDERAQVDLRVGGGCRIRLRVRTVRGHIRSREVTHLPLSDDCLPGLLTWIAARCEPLASLESRGESLRTQGQSGTL